MLDWKMCLIQERLTRERLGTGTRCNGLWYMDREVTSNAVCNVLAATVGEEAMVMLQHCRMRHLSFDKMSKVVPNVMCGVDKTKLVCDAREFGKHIRTSYVSRGIRSISPFVIIHSDVWTSPVTSVSGMKHFVTFTDCYSRMTWVYLMRHKYEVFRCFQDFHSYVKKRFNKQVRVIRTDNGTEYVNKEFGTFLSAEGILHSWPDLPP
jgi:transposase InsO family protein